MQSMGNSVYNIVYNLVYNNYVWYQVSTTCTQ